MGSVPTMTTPARLADALAQANDAAGYAVAAEGAIAVVGARGADAGAANAGKLCVFVRSGTAWQQAGSLVEALPLANAQFGRALALSQTTLAATAATADGSGRVTAFTRAGSSLNGAAVLASPNGAAGDAMGTSISTDGEWIAVGAPARAGGGAVELFRRAAGAWSYAGTVAPPMGGTAAGFGRSVALSGTTLAVGAPADGAAGDEAGAVFVFEWASGSWQPSAEVRPADASTGALFGNAVALDGNLLVVGAYRDDSVGTDSGSAYVFRRAAGAWALAQKLAPETSIGDADFGYSVATLGGRIAVGAPAAIVGGQRRGTAYLFVDAGFGTFAPQLRVGAPTGSTQAFAGTGVALSATHLLTGAPLDPASAPYAGATAAVDIVSDCDANGQTDAVAIAFGAADLDRNGVPDTCECAGDLNGDGTTSGQDLGILLGFWGTPATTLPRADINRDGLVTGADLGLLLADWGPCT